MSTIKIEAGSVLVVSEWTPDEDGHGSPSVIRAVCSSVDEIGALLERLGVYYPGENDLVFERHYGEEIANFDPDLFATFEIVIVHESDEREETDFRVWVSTLAKAAYAPLKLYWCTTDGGEEDWFMIAHTGKEAEVQHADAEGFDLDEPSAEFVMVLPPELQEKGNEILGWPTLEMLITCGAKVVREKSPRVVEIGGKTFTEGMTDHTIEQLLAGRRPIEN